MTTRIPLIAFVLTLCPLVGQAQLLSGLDYTKRADKIGNMRFNTGEFPLKENKRIGNTEFSASEWQKSYSGVLGQQARLNQKSEFKSKEFDTSVRSYNSRRPKIARESNRMATFKNMDREVKAPLVRKYENASVAQVAPTGQRIDNALETMSLNDLNRYTFQRSTATRTKKGIDATRAGSGE